MNLSPDTLYKQLFSHPELVRELLRAFLPQTWVLQLDVTAFERISASYVSDGGQQRHSDLVWRIKVGAQAVYVYLLLELQATPDPWMALRMQVYVGLLYQDLVKRHQLSAGDLLPPVLPLVLYHGSARWTACMDLAGLLLTPPDGLQLFQPQQRYLLVAPQTGMSPVQDNLVAALLDLVHARSYAAIEQLFQCVAARLKEDDMQSVRESVRRWIQFTLLRSFGYSNLTLEPDLEEAVMMNVQLGRIEQMMKDHLIEIYSRRGLEEGLQKGLQEGRQKGLQEGRQEGRQIGLQEGRQEGRQEGLQQGERQAYQEMLGLLAAQRGIALPSDARWQLEHAGIEQLKCWLAEIAAGRDPW